MSDKGPAVYAADVADNMAISATEWIETAARLDAAGHANARELAIGCALGLVQAAVSYAVVAGRFTHEEAKTVGTNAQALARLSIRGIP